MKHARKRWLAMVAVCLGLASPARSELKIVPDESPYDTGSRFEISDSDGTARLGGNASGSVRQVQAEEFVPPPSAPSAYDAAFQNAPPAYDNSVGFANMATSNQLFWRLGRNNMDQYGYDGGYTNFNVFVPVFGSPDDTLLWVNPRLNVTDYGMAGANLGVGLRKYNAERDRVYGASFWYDYDDGHASDFSQLGGSFESIGNYYSLRGNFGVPIGETSAYSSSIVGTPNYVGHNISAQVTRYFDNAMKSFDIELATPMPGIGRYGFEWGLGIYHLAGDNIETTGGSARAQSQITENLWLNGIYTYDDMFQSQFSLNFEVTLGKGMARRFFRRPPVQSYMTQSVQRRYRIPVGQTSSSSYQNAMDPNGVEITIVYIDPTRAPSASNDGTYENAYASTDEYNALSGADQNQFQIIMVRRSDDPADAGKLDSGITLRDGPAGSYTGQRLFGDADLPENALPLTEAWFAGADSPLAVNIINDLRRTSGFGGLRPTLSNAGGDVITIAGNSNEVFGMNIDGMDTGSGIVNAPGTTTNGFYIHGNNFQNVVNGIDLVSDTSTPLGLAFDGLGVISNNVITAGTAGDYGIRVQHVNGDGANALQLLVGNTTNNGLNPEAGNNVSGFEANPGSSAGIFILADGPTSEIIATGTATTPAGTAFPVQAPPIQAGQTFDLGVNANTVDASATGIGMLADNGATIFADVNNNTVTNSTDPLGDGIAIQADNASEFNLITFNNNSMIGNAGNGGLIQAENGSTIIVWNPILDNQFVGNDENGLFVNANNSDVIIAGIGDGTVENRNQFNNNDENGLEILAEASGSVIIAEPFFNQQFNTNGDNGLLATSTGAGSEVFMIIGDPTDGSTLGNEFVANGLFSGTGAGISLNVDTDAELTAPIFNNLVVANIGNGIEYNLDNAATTPFILMQGNAVRSNGLNGVAITSDNTDVDLILFTDNVVLGSLGGDGLDITALNGSTLDVVAVAQNGLQLNNRHGFDLNLDGSFVNELFVVDNQGGEALAAGTLGFNYVNTTVGNTMTNTSSAGLQVGRVILNIEPTGQGFRPDLTNVNEQFLPTGGTDVTTGLIAVNGNGMIAGTDPLQGTDGEPLPGGGILSGAQILDLTFTDFATGESLTYDLAHTQLANDTLQPGSSLVGSIGTVILEDGRSVTATFTGTGLAINQALAAVGTGISNNGQNGVNINAENASAIGAITIENNMVQTNNNNGIEFTATGASLLPGSGAPIIINNNTIQDQVTGDGIRMLNPDTGGVEIGMDVINNRILNNAGAGVNVEVNSLSGSIVSNITGNTIDSNGSFGLTYSATQNATVDLTVGGPASTDRNVINNNMDANIALNLSNDVAGSVSRMTVQNNLITNARDGANSNFDGEGVSIFTTNLAELETADIIDNMITGNAGDGIEVLANGFSQIHAVGDPTSPGLLIDGNVINENGLNGVQVVRQGSAVVNGQIGSTGGTYDDPTLAPPGNYIVNNGIHGIDVNTTGSMVVGSDAVYLVAGQNLIGGNAGNGVNISTGGTSNTRVDLISNIITGTFGTSATQQQNGISLTTNDVSYFGTVGGDNSLWDGNIIFGNSQNGIRLARTNTGSAISEMHVDIFGNVQQSQIFDNGTNGIQIVDNSNQQVLVPDSVSAVMEINVGDPASFNPPLPEFGADVAPDRPNVIIAQNTIDGIQVIQTGTEILLLDINNVLALGGQQSGTASRHGLSFNSDGQQMHDADTVILVNHSTFTGFGDDGMNFFFANSYANPSFTGVNTSVGGTLNVLVQNSIIGQNESSFNGGDGVDIEIRDNGANFVFDHNLIQNNVSDGFRMSLHAERLTSGVDGSNNRPRVVPTRDATGDGIADTVRPDQATLNAAGNYEYNNTLSVGLDQEGNGFAYYDGAPFADQSFIDVTAGLTLTDNLIRFNGRDGVQLALGAATRLGLDGMTAVDFVNDITAIPALDVRLTQYGRANVSGNDMSGNDRFGFYTLTQDALDTAIVGTSGARTTANATPPANLQTIQLDPLAHLWLSFENNIGSVLNPTVVGGVYNNDPTKSSTSNRPIQTNFNVDFGGTINTFTVAGGGPDALSTYQRFFTQWNRIYDSLSDSGANSPTYWYNVNGTAIINDPGFFGIQP